MHLWPTLKPLKPNLKFITVMHVSLEQVKQHLIIEDNVDDLYLLDLITVAEDAIAKNCNIRNLDELVGENETLPPTIVQSILLLIGTLYSNRESVAFTVVNKVPHTLDYLIGLDKNYNDNCGIV